MRFTPTLVRRALEAIAGARPGILIHCSAGRDRTGMIVSMLLANAGVAPEAIADDYAESVRVMAGADSHSPTHGRQAIWSQQEASAWIEKTWPIVVSFAEGIDRSFEQIELRHADRQSLRALLLTT